MTLAKSLTSLNTERTEPQPAAHWCLESRTSVAHFLVCAPAFEEQLSLYPGPFLPTGMTLFFLLPSCIHTNSYLCHNRTRAAFTHSCSCYPSRSENLIIEEEMEGLVWLSHLCKLTRHQKMFTTEPSSDRTTFKHSRGTQGERVWGGAQMLVKDSILAHPS